MSSSDNRLTTRLRHWKQMLALKSIHALNRCKQLLESRFKVVRYQAGENWAMWLISLQDEISGLSNRSKVVHTPIMASQDLKMLS